MSTRVSGKVIVRVALIGIWGLLTIWMVKLSMERDRDISQAQRMDYQSFEEQNDLIRAYMREVDMLKETLREAENVRQQLTLENGKLREKVALLDEVVEMEQTIARLKQENARIINHMSSIKRAKPFNTKDLDSLDKAYKAMDDFDMKKAQVKDKIRALKAEARDKRLAAKKELDRIKTMVGNNGYLVRNGRPAPPAPVMTEEAQQLAVEIDVRFVD